MDQFIGIDSSKILPFPSLAQTKIKSYLDNFSKKNQLSWTKMNQT